MRLRAVWLIAVAVLGLSFAPTRLAADPPQYPASALGYIVPVASDDTRCPAATHALVYCPGLTPIYLLFDKAKGRGNNSNVNPVVVVRGDLDPAACPPFTLMHVGQVARYEGVPIPCPPPPCFPPACTPGY